MEVFCHVRLLGKIGGGLLYRAKPLLAMAIYNTILGPLCWHRGVILWTLLGGGGCKEHSYVHVQVIMHDMVLRVQ
jgi:hypothetical protein